MTQKQINILAIESSCDDTACAVLQNKVVLSNVIANQKVHAEYGGVVPELASREHQAHIIPVVHQALQQANLEISDMHAIAVTRGPGLLGSLLVGVTFAKSLAVSLNIPLIEVNHMRAHVSAHFIGATTPQFPFLCLTVSGGHTQLVLVKDHYDMTIIGQTLDDAAGEAFDKTGKMLGLPYPSGPIIDQYASRGKAKFTLPFPNIPDFNYSFSGLKTAIKYFLEAELKKDDAFIEKELPHICASVQEQIISILLDKMEKAAEHYEITHMAIAGGVSANSSLRKRFTEMGLKKGWDTYIPEFAYCTDNAAMIGIQAYYKFLKGQFSSLNIVPDPRMKV